MFAVVKKAEATENHNCVYPLRVEGTEGRRKFSQNFKKLKKKKKTHCKQMLLYNRAIYILIY